MVIIMGKKRINKIVGRISKDVARKYNLYSYEGQEIIQSLDLYAHIQKHVKEFNSVDGFNNAISNIDKIIDEPYFVYYDKQRNSLMYFKEIEEDVCAVVKLKLREKEDNYVSTIYPVSKRKIDKLKERSYYADCKYA